MAADIQIVQAGKLFLKDISPDQAEKIADKPDEVKKYAVDTIEIHAGDTLEFLNKDSVMHNVFLISPAFNFIQQPGSSHKYTFEKAGTYDVRCAIHPKMKVRVVVE